MCDSIFFDLMTKIWELICYKLKFKQCEELHFNHRCSLSLLYHYVCLKHSHEGVSVPQICCSETVLKYSAFMTGGSD